MTDRVKELEAENLALKKQVEKLNTPVFSRKKNKFLIRLITTIFTGKKLKTSIYHTVSEFNEEKRISLETLSDLAASIIRRFTRVGVVALLFALLPATIMLYQNSLLNTQNKKIQEQTYLAEASRRSAQMFIMGDILSDINTELETKKNNKLSNTLVGRVVGLSRAMKPYRYLVNDKLIEKSISPERGQLLITLCKSEIEPSFFVDRILQESDFTKSELQHVNLHNAILRDVNMASSDFKNAHLLNIDARRGVFTDTNFTNADLEDANFSHANLTNANLTGAILLHTNFTDANLTNVTLDNALVDNINWLEGLKNKLKLKGAEELYEKYRIDSVYSKQFNKKVPTIVKNGLF